MTVWYSSCNDDVISDRAHKEYFKSLVDDLMTYHFITFLKENYHIHELFEFTDHDRAVAREKFEKWAHEKAEGDDAYEAYEVRLASDEEEE